jgi:uncharacterized repeat protein (TIGR03803 family)
MRLFKRMILGSLLVLLVSPPLCRAEVPAEVIGQFPGMTDLWTAVPGRDGILYGIGYNNRGGFVYRVAPGETLHVLHQFPELPTSLMANEGGSEPSRSFLISEDGCLYGLTANGGQYGQGVLYRIDPEGTFAVLGDLNPDTLPQGTLSSAYFVSPGIGFLEGPDNAFYILQPDRGAVVRIARNGALSVVGQTGYAYQVLRDPARPYDMLAVTVQQPPFEGPYGPAHWGIRLRRFSIQEGAVIQDISSPLFEAPFRSPTGLKWTPQGLLLLAERSDSQETSSRLFRMNLDGSMTPLTDFAWYGDSPLAPFMVEFVRAEEDGTIYYTTGWPEEGNAPGGTTLIELKPNGQFKTICGFGKAALFSITSEANRTLVGASYGNQICAPLQQNGYTRNWMDKANAANLEILKHPGNRGMFVRIPLSGD